MKPSNERKVQSLQFIGAQQGSPERILKNALVFTLATHAEIKNAYLARVMVGRQSSVALCIRASGGPNQLIVDEVGKVFARIFGASEFLDVIFLSEKQEISLAKVCEPFFSRA